MQFRVPTAFRPAISYERSPKSLVIPEACVPVSLFNSTREGGRAMTSWRDVILKHFVPPINRLTLVADPDALLTEEKLALELRSRGVDLMEFSNAIEFRYAFESQFRSLWDQDKGTDLFVVLRVPSSTLDALPYDLLRVGKGLAFDLGSIFPHFSLPVLQSLDRSLLDSLHEAQNRAQLDQMGDYATKDFLLRHVFGFAVELIATDVELLRALLRLHNRSTPLPRVLRDRILQAIETQAAFRSWPIEEIISDETAFYAFLQERWPVYLQQHEGSGFRDDGVEYDLAYPGPRLLPFGHHDIRVYIDNLFVEGKLTPVDPPVGRHKPHGWTQSGITRLPTETSVSRTERLFDLIENERPEDDCRFTDWIAFARKWAELAALVHVATEGGTKQRHRRTGEELNGSFARWLDGHYASLINSPPNRPAMVHHVTRHIERELERSKQVRAALIVVDGLALDQWITVRHALKECNPALLMHESAVFAWIPTLTSISRQAIFAGRPPLFFPSSIHTTNAERKLWRKRWQDAGFSKTEIAYQRALGDMPSSGDISESLDDALISPRTRIAGLVVDTVDRIMHGMQLGSSGMHNQVAQWCRQGFLSTLISDLLDRGFDVWLMSDHGNIECKGLGRPREGVVAEIRGERVRVYPTPEQRDRTARDFSFARKWNPVGLPTGTFPLMAQGTAAFVAPGEMPVGHGGISIEEVIVPMIRFRR